MQLRFRDVNSFFCSCPLPICLILAAGGSLSMIITVCRCSTSLPIRPLLPPYPLAPTAAPLPSKSAAFPWSRSLPSRPPCLLCCPPGRHYLPRTKTILRSIRCRVLLHVAQARQFDSSLSRCRFRPPSSWVYDCFAVAKSCQPPCGGIADRHLTRWW